MKTSEAIKVLKELKFFKSESQALAIQHAIDFMSRYQWQPIETLPKDIKGELLILLKDGTHQLGYINDKGWLMFFNNGDYCYGPYGQDYRAEDSPFSKPTHWMIPPQPEDD